MQTADKLKNYLPDPKTSKIAVAMSGGVDSSVAVYLLKEAGYEVVGITAWIVSGTGRCCDNGVVDAVRICDMLGIEHHAVDLREEFKAGIVKDFHESYQRGETPIPCISCNNDVKWGNLLQYSIDKLGATHLASGHYAKLVETKSGNFELFRPIEDKKDQSYMLWGLTQDQLSKTIFPLADLTKPEIRKIAADADMCIASKPDSQDICFVSNGMTNSDYLLKVLGEKPGPIIEIESGKELGQHKGSFNFTYGQRKGIGIAYPEPLYVVKVDPKQNIVYVGTRDKLASQFARAKNRNIIAELDLDQNNSFMAMTKIRYNSDPSMAKITLEDNNMISAEFIDPVDSITPGQAIVFYDPVDPLHVLGGAWLV